MVFVWTLESVLQVAVFAFIVFWILTWLVLDLLERADRWFKKWRN